MKKKQNGKTEMWVYTATRQKTKTKTKIVCCDPFQSPDLP